MKKGFSLIEILIMLFIVLSLAAMATGIVLRSRALSKSMFCLNNLRQISMAIENYQADWKTSPIQIYSLFPNYIKEKHSFKCPEDKTVLPGELPMKNSYGNFYANRSFQDEDTYKIYLYCPRHFNGTKGVGAFLSYSANIVQNNTVKRNGVIVKPGDVNDGGTYVFADGTVVTAQPGMKVGLCGSFVAPDDKNYSIIFVPEDSSGSLTVEHQGDSRFEIITPALIAGVSGTKFNVTNTFNSSSNQATTTVSVNEGKVQCEDRIDGSKSIVAQNQNISITVECQPESTRIIENKKTKSIPVKPKKRIKILRF